MRVKFWGVRGSIASPIKGHHLRNKIEKILSIATPVDIQSKGNIQNFLDSLSFSLISTYGGNTTCLEIRDKDENLIIMDGGTGLRELGNSLLSQGFLEGKGKAYWVFSHTHWDHIQGIPFFVPMYIPGNRFEIFTSMHDLEERLKHQHPGTHFPVPFEGLRASKTFQHIDEGKEFQIGKHVTCYSKAVRHPGGNFAYKFTEEGKTLIFASDAEFSIDEMENIENYLSFFEGADVLVFDTQYTFEESLQKIDWGHSSASIATDIALKANVKKLVMFHHDPSYDDDKLDAVYLRALKYKEMLDKNNALEIIMAHEGLELNI